MNIYLGLNMWDCITIVVFALLLCFTALGINAASNERKVKIAQAQAFALAHAHGIDPVAALAEVTEAETQTEVETGTGRHRALVEDRAAAVKALSKKLYGDTGEKKEQEHLHLMPVVPLVKRKGRGPLVSLSSGEVFDEDEDEQEGVNQTGRWAD